MKLPEWLKCKIGFHEWSKWTDYHESPLGISHKQFSTCNRCNMTKERVF